MHLEPLKQMLAGKSSILGALVSGGLGIAAAEYAPTGLNTMVIVALCGAAGAFFGCLPRLIIALSGADASARGLLAKELQTLLARIHKLEQRVVLEQGAKHVAQSEHNGLVIHIGNLRELMRAAGLIPPEFKIKSYYEMFGGIDREIKELVLVEDQP